MPHIRSAALAITMFCLVTPIRAQVHFTSCAARTADNAILIIPTSSSPSLDGQPLQNGDEIAVVRPDGRCAGVSVWGGVNTALTVWGSDEYSAVNGLSAGDSLTIIVWDASAGVELRPSRHAYATGQPHLLSTGRYVDGGIYELTALEMVSPPTAPVPVYPGAGASGLDASVTLAWRTVPGATSYDVEVSESETFSPVVAGLTGALDTTYAVTGLRNGTTYFWRVRARMDQQQGTYSASRAFSTAPLLAAPALLSPADGATGQSIRPTLSWQAAEGALTYTVQLASTADFTSLLHSQGSIAATSLLLADLPGGRTIFWRVRGDNAEGSSAFSTPSRFTTVASHRLQLQEGWNMVSSYVAPGEAGLESLFSPVEEQLFMLKDNAGNTFVPGLGINTVGSWSATQGYKVFMEAPADLMVSGSVLIPESTPVALQEGWNLVGYLRRDTMRVQQAIGSAADQIVLVKDGAGNIYVPELAIDDVVWLEPGAGYMVYATGPATLTYPANTSHVQNAASNALSSTDSLRRTSMSVAAESGAAAFSANLIVEAASVGSGTEVSVWSGERQVAAATVAGGRAVLLIRGDDPHTPDVVEGARSGDPLTLKTGAEAGGAALKLEGLRSLLSSSEETSFVYADDQVWIATAAGTGDGPEEPPPFALMQNYPNPFTSATTIEYSLAGTADVTLEVFDVLGRRVHHEEARGVPEGGHRFHLDLGGLPPGAYVYRLRAGAEVSTRTMIRVR